MYESFLEASQIYGKANTSLERVDVNKPYSKDNCKWVHKKEQPTNQRKIKSFKAMSPTGEEYIAKNVTQFCREHDLHRGSVSDVLHGRSRHHRGWIFTYNIEV